MLLKCYSLFVGSKRKAAEEEDEPWEATLHESWQIIYVMLIKSLLKCGFDPSVEVLGTCVLSSLVICAL